MSCPQEQSQAGYSVVERQLRGSLSQRMLHLEHGYWRAMVGRLRSFSTISMPENDISLDLPWVFLKKSDVEIVQQARSMHISTSRCGQKLSESRYSDGPLQRGCVGSRGVRNNLTVYKYLFVQEYKKGTILYQTTTMKMVVRMHKATLEWCTLKLRLAGV